MELTGTRCICDMAVSVLLDEWHAHSEMEHLMSAELPAVMLVMLCERRLRAVSWAQRDAGFARVTRADESDEADGSSVAPSVLHCRNE